MTPYGPTLTHWVEENVKDKEVKQCLLLLTNYRFVRGLRGPDGDGDTAMAFKHIVTQRLRGIVSAYVWCVQPHLMECYWDVTHEAMGQDVLDGLRSVCQATVKEAPHAYANPMYHFLDRLVSAVEQVKDHPIWGGHGQEVISLINNTVDQLGVCYHRKDTHAQ